MRNVWRLTVLTVLVAITPGGAVSAETGGPTASKPSLTIVADLIDRFDDKLAKNGMAMGPRGEMSSGRSTHRAMYEHPKNADDATITYSIKLPDKPADGQIAFVGWACVLDDVLKKDKDKRANGVRMMVRVNGGQVFARDHMPGAWLPVVVPLDKYAGQTIELQLASNAINGNTNYDWAHWGDPRVMILSDGGEVGAEPVPGLAGLLIAPAKAAGKKGVKLNLQPVNAAGAPAGGDVDVWLEPAPGCPMTVAQFDLSKHLKPGASKVRIKAADGQLPGGLRVLGYSPEVKLVGLTAGRAVIAEGDDLPICVTIRNEGLAPWVPSGERLYIRIGEPTQASRQAMLNWQDPGDGSVAIIDDLGGILPPGREAIFAHRFRAPAPGRAMVLAQFGLVTSRSMLSGRGVHVYKAAEVFNERVEQKTTADVRRGQAVVQNPTCRVVFIKQSPGRWTVHFQLPVKGKWRTAAVCPNLLDVYVGRSKRQEKAKTPNRERVKESRSAFRQAECRITSVRATAQESNDRTAITFGIKLEAAGRERQAHLVNAKLTYSLNKTDPIVEVTGELTAPKGAPLRRFCPISLRVADGLPTKDRGQALFPGLEYLNDGEPSSSTRDAHPPVNNRLMPDPLKVTVPMMMVSTQVGMVTLMWNPNQKWNGKDYGPCAAFASPNLVHRQENHLMELFVPTFPEYVNENERLAAESYEMKPGSTVTVSARIVLRPKGDAVTAMQDYFKLNPPPKPAPKQYDLQTLYAISRHGFMKTVWYEDKQKSSHCVGWSPANAPQFGVMLWLGSILTDDAAARKASLERADLIWRNTIRDAGPAGLLSPACCHILRGEAPFYTGHIEAAVGQMLKDAAGAVRGRNADGVWGFEPPHDARHEALGPRGYASQGIVGRGALNLMRLARITGDADALAAGLKALDYHERFGVPHGAQGWECPIYEPDVLGAAYAIGAYLDAYEMTGEKRYLDRATYWAWTGMAFQYAWQAPDREQWMRYASIPVLGTTFFTHSWLGNPVQWCGLVYAYYLQKLAAHDRSFPWKRVAEGITVSGEWLQFGDERPELKGAYPDGLYKRLTDRCPAMINPEDIVLNRYAIEGHDPRVKTRYARRAGAPTIHITSCAKLGAPRLAGKTLTVPLTFYKNQYSGTLLAHCPTPSAVSLGDQALASVETIPASPQGWKYLPDSQHLIVRARHADGKPVALTVRFK